MRYSRRFVLSMGLVMATVTARADESAAARALVEKAMLAEGGEAKLAKFPVAIVKFKGVFHGSDDIAPPFTFTGEAASQGADRLKFIFNGNVKGYKFRTGAVLNGNRGWKKFNDEMKEFNKEELAEFQEMAYADWVASLVPLKDKAFTLKSLGEVNINKRPALGICVSSKGHPDVKLFFDKETSLLVKTESLLMDGGQELTIEKFLSNYETVQDIKVSMKASIKRNGKPHQEIEVIQYRLAEMPDDGTFDKP
jgi:hypothetical protein